MSAKARSHRWSAVAAVVAFAATCFAGDGLRLVEERLRTPPDFHLDISRGAVFFNGVASAPYDVAKDAPHLAALRERLCAKAVLNAKTDMARYLSQRFAVWEKVVDKSARDASAWRSVSSSSGSSGVSLRGCTISDCAELFDDGDFFVAVTVEWSVEAHDAANIAARGAKLYGDDAFQALRKALKDAEIHDIAGARMFRVDAGCGEILVPVGAAIVDIDGLSGLRMKAAIEKADAAAQRFFESAVVAPLDVTFSDSSDATSLGSSRRISETMVVSSESVATGLNRVPRRLAYSGILRDPVTQRKLYVVAFVPDVFKKS